MWTTIFLLLHLTVLVVAAQVELSCASVTCDEGTTCRIVYNPKNSVTRPSCENPNDIPRNAGSVRCKRVGGLPLLELVRDGRRRKLRVYKKRGRDCPPPGIAHKGMCCYQNEKLGECPASGDLGICVKECESDSECHAQEKCCPTGCAGSFTCTDPVSERLTCKTTKCAEGHECIDTPHGPECVLIDRPGICPLFECLPPEYPTCRDRCIVDADCEPSDKCCMTCDGCRSCIVFLPPLTCANVRCTVDTTCIDTPKGPTCAPNNPGFCPPIPCQLIFPPPACNSTCRADVDCRKGEKCCQGCGDCTICVEAGVVGSSCASILCIVNTTCIETPRGPQCVPITKPGNCPVCGNEGEPASNDPSICVSFCENDNKCAGDLKCCLDCFGCHTCTEPLLLPSCDNTECPAGQACVIQEIQCIRAPCDTKPTCVDTEPKSGVCPPPSEGGSTCVNTCEYDSQCPESQKCCSNACGATQCSNPFVITGRNCSVVTCPEGFTCRMVFDRSTETTSPDCLRNPPKGEHDSACLWSDPLLVREKDRTLTVGFCGRGLDTVACPEGFNCVVAPDDTYALCCPEVVGRDICYLPAETGRCRASIPRKYFDYNAQRCREFMYGGCGGNENNFEFWGECNRRCGFITCPESASQTPAGGCERTGNDCTAFGEAPRKCPVGQTCCKTPCGRRCFDV